jgi:L-alanine-DL-glutamate epimerase-like enolase superfamily enzyme
MKDPLAEHDIGTDGFPDDGLPVALTQVIARYRNRYFKIKLCGDVEADIARLTQIAAVLDPLADYRVTLDGNEQFADVAAVAHFVDALVREPCMARLRDATLYLEQPLARSIAFDTGVHAVATAMPLIIDESDATIDAFVRARALGYAGVSSKTCKGIYKSLLNSARCARWNASGHCGPVFMTGEDLTAQPGLAVQQDLALAAALGLTHVERNGHHYVAGFAGQYAPIPEQQAFLAAHPDLYVRTDDRVALAIRDGEIALDSLAVVGFASGAWPDVESMQPIGYMGPEQIHSTSQV